MTTGHISKDTVEERIKAIFKDSQFTQADPTLLVEWAFEALKEHGPESPVSTRVYEEGAVTDEMYKFTPPSVRVTYEDRNLPGGDPWRFIAVTLVELIH